MEQNLKELLLKDLCARLPYGVKFHYFPEFADGEDPEFDNTIVVVDIADEQILDEDHEDYIPIRQIKPYLRPMSNMTEEESKEYFSICTGSIRGDMIAKIDFYIKHHFDFRLTSEGLSMIEAGLALEALDGMYNLKEK